MNVQELIELLETMNPEAEVWLDCGYINCIAAENVRESGNGEEVIIS